MSTDFIAYGTYGSKAQFYKASLRWDNDDDTDITITNDDLYTYVSKTFKVTVTDYTGLPSSAPAAIRGYPRFTPWLTGKQGAAKNLSPTSKGTQVATTVIAKYERPLTGGTNLINLGIDYWSASRTTSQTSSTANVSFSFSQEARTKKEVVLKINHPLGSASTVEVEGGWLESTEEVLGNGSINNIMNLDADVENAFVCTDASGRYIFTGIYFDAACTQKVTFPYDSGTSVSKTLYAGWEKVKKPKVYGVADDKSLIDITKQTEQVLLEYTYSGPISAQTCESKRIGNLVLERAGIDTEHIDDYIIASIYQRIILSDGTTQAWRTGLTGYGCNGQNTSLVYPALRMLLSGSGISGDFTIHVCNDSDSEASSIDVRVLFQRVKHSEDE